MWPSLVDLVVQALFHPLHSLAPNLPQSCQVLFLIGLKGPLQLVPTDDPANLYGNHLLQHKGQLARVVNRPELNHNPSGLALSQLHNTPSPALEIVSGMTVL